MKAHVLKDRLKYVDDNSDICVEVWVTLLRPPHHQRFIVEAVDDQQHRQLLINYDSEMPNDWS